MLMKKQFTQVLLSLIAMLALPNLAWADREVLQSQLGKQTITVASDEVITFYDPWGTENNVDDNSYNSQSLTVFKAADPGMSVQITFEKIDLNQYNTSYFLYLNLYDGIADADDSFSWPSTTSEVTSSSSLAGMSGTLLAEKINNGNKPSLPAVYISGTADDDDQRTVEYYLADYRSENEGDWYYVNDWKYVDLSSLGTVKELSFHLVSSRSNAYGYTTPLYFCVDDFGAPAPEGTSVQDVLKTGNTDDGYFYDLHGRRVQHPTRGIYVRNGKKVLIK